MTKLALLSTLALTPALAQASVTLDFSAGTLFQSDGTTALPLNSTIALIADADNDGWFGNFQYLNGSYVADSGDVLIGTYGTNDLLGSNGSHAQSITFDLTGGVDAGDALIVAVFEQAFSASNTGPGTPRVNYLTYRSDVGLDGSAPWVVPADGETVALNFITADLAGSTSNAAGTTSAQTTILGDLDSDGDVDADDFGIFAGQFGSNTTNLTGDLDSDNDVDADDFGIFAGQFGNNAGGFSAIPEPTTFGILGLASLALLRRRDA